MTSLWTFLQSSILSMSRILIAILQEIKPSSTGNSSARLPALGFLFYKVTVIFSKDVLIPDPKLQLFSIFCKVFNEFLLLQIKTKYIQQAKYLKNSMFCLRNQLTLSTPPCFRFCWPPQQGHHSSQPCDLWHTLSCGINI